MPTLKSVGELESLRASILGKRDPQKAVITICNGTGCHAHGCVGVTEAFREAVKSQGLEDKVDVRATGCHGFCERGPLVVIKPKGILYQRVRVKDVPEILGETVVKDNVIERMLYTDRASGRKIELEHEVPFYQGQQRLVLGNNGLSHGYADGIAKQMQQVDRWEFLHADNLHDLIAALEKQYGAHGRARSSK